MPHDPLHLLCVEPRFPGRLGAVADWLVRRRGYRCTFYFNAADPPSHWPESAGRGLDLVPFNVGGVARESSVSWTRQLERGLCYAYGCWEVLEARRPRPIELVLGRSAGLGSTLFVPVYLPGIPIVNLFDYFYHPRANDLADDAPENAPSEYYHWRRAANAMDLLDLENGVTPWAPTAWQRDLYPAEYHDDFEVLCDGIDARLFSAPARRRGSSARQVAGRSIASGTSVVSFVARNLDRTRGFDRFMPLANRLLEHYSDLICIVIGAASVQRGLDIEFYNRDYREHVLRQSPPHDPDRIWFLDTVPQRVVAELLAVTDLHVYASRRFVVARSLLEAMAAGCVVLACDSEPVREFLNHGESALLVTPGDLAEADRQARAVLDDPAAYAPLGAAAASTVQQRFASDVTMPLVATLFDQLVR